MRLRQTFEERAPNILLIPVLKNHKIGSIWCFSTNYKQKNPHTFLRTSDCFLLSYVTARKEEKTTKRTARRQPQKSELMSEKMAAFGTNRIRDDDNVFVMKKKERGTLLLTLFCRRRQLVFLFNKLFSGWEEIEKEALISYLGSFLERRRGGVYR